MTRKTYGGKRTSAIVSRLLKLDTGQQLDMQASHGESAFCLQLALLFRSSLSSPPPPSSLLFFFLSLSHSQSSLRCDLEVPPSFIVSAAFRIRLSLHASALPSLIHRCGKDVFLNNINYTVCRCLTPTPHSNPHFLQKMNTFPNSKHPGCFCWFSHISVERKKKILCIAISLWCICFGLIYQCVCGDLSTHKPIYSVNRGILYTLMHDPEGCLVNTVIEAYLLQNKYLRHTLTHLS